MKHTHEAYLIVLCDESDNSILAADIWSSQEWQQSRQLPCRTYVAYSVSGTSYHKAYEAMVEIINDPRSRYHYLQRYLDHRRLGTSTIPCKKCSQPTDSFGTELCDPCWRREHAPRRPEPGFRKFECEDCGREWFDYSRDRMSPSGEDCPNPDCAMWTFAVPASQEEASQMTEGLRNKLIEESGR